MGCSASKAHAFVTKDKHSWNLSASSQSQCAYSNGCGTPLSRTLSRPASFVHHPPKAKGDTDHLVALLSTTYGSLLHLQDPNIMNQDLVNSSTTQESELRSVCDSPHSVINTWELMEGLDDDSPDFVDVASEFAEDVEKIEGFEAEDVEKIEGCEVDAELITDYEVVEYKDSKPLWQHLSVESLLANMDPNVGSSYRKALRSKRFGNSERKDVVMKGFRDSELDRKSRRAIAEMDLDRKKEFDGKKLHERTSRKWNSEPNVSAKKDKVSAKKDRVSAKKDKIVLYYTSVRGIRKTYQDCCEIRMIFKEYRVFVDERDTAMDPSYRKELQDMLKGKKMSLPQVFVKGEYIGGADQIRKFHEVGLLGEILKGFPTLDLAVACGRCGDARFVLCMNCNGSRKVFVENKAKMRCLECNENGLVRCPSC